MVVHLDLDVTHVLVHQYKFFLTWRHALKALFCNIWTLEISSNVRTIKNIDPYSRYDNTI